MTGTYTHNGKTYYGAKAVAEVLGISPRTVYYRLDKHGTLDPVEDALQYEWNGKWYATVRDVAEASGRTQNTVRSHLKRRGNLLTLGTGVAHPTLRKGS